MCRSVDGEARHHAERADHYAYWNVYPRESACGYSEAEERRQMTETRPFVTFATTNYNTAPVTSRSLDSILSRVRGLDYEIVCTDNLSDDGSYERLAEYRDRGYPITLIRRRCGRGLGREIARRQGRGDIVVAFDLDTVYSDEWRRLLDWYLERRPAYALIATYSGYYPRAALDAVGGWRDFQYWEDVDLWIRLATKGLWRTYPMACGENLKRNPTGLRKKSSRLYARMRDTIAIGSWIPLWVSWRGYARMFPITRSPVRNLYYHSLLLASYAPGRLKRFRWCRRDYRIEALMDSAAFVDVGIVPPARLRPLVTDFDTRDGILRAAQEGRFFVPGVYD